VIPGEVDGVRGDKAKAALGEFARVAKVTLPSDAPNADALQAALGQKGRACPRLQKSFPSQREGLQINRQEANACAKYKRIKPFSLLDNYAVIAVIGKVCGLLDSKHGLAAPLHIHIRASDKTSNEFPFERNPWLRRST
jgi:hypothetical protein